MRDRRCEGCGAKMKGESLRPTRCLDGPVRWFCEWCAMDEVERIREEQRQLKEMVSAKDY